MYEAAEVAGWQSIKENDERLKVKDKRWNNEQFIP